MASSPVQLDINKSLSMASKPLKSCSLSPSQLSPSGAPNSSDASLLDVSHTYKVSSHLRTLVLTFFARYTFLQVFKCSLELSQLLAFTLHIILFAFFIVLSSTKIIVKLSLKKILITSNPTVL